MIDIMLDLETWGTDPGDDIRSIGACVFDRSNGVVAKAGDDFAMLVPATFYIACDNPSVYISGDPENPDSYVPKYPLARNRQTEQWWSEQSEAARSAFADPVDLKDALRSFTGWIQSLYTDDMISGRGPSPEIRLWSHGKNMDEPILRVAYQRLGLPVPWHYRAPRDTRTIMEAAGMDPHKGLEPFSTGTHHHALDDAITQARAVCEAFRRLIVPTGLM